MKIKVYCDGSCKPNPGMGGVGIVILIDDNLHTSGGIYLGPSTNNIAELQAIYHSLKLLKENNLSQEEIEVCTDSQYAVGLLAKGWKAKANQELVQQIKDMLNEFPKLSFSWVRGHNGESYNELADKLANKSIDDQK